MFNKIWYSTYAVVLFLLLVVLFLSSCGTAQPGHTPPNPQPTRDIPVVEAKAVSYDGVWKSTGDIAMTAVIKGNLIEIDMISSDDSASIYWVGTFPVRPAETVITSIPDLDILEYAILASQAKSKVFTYQDEKLSFDFKMLGTKHRIHLEKI